jgi:hypothetical protein
MESLNGLAATQNKIFSRVKQFRLHFGGGSRNGGI